MTEHPDEQDEDQGRGITRRRMVGYLLAGPVLIAAASTRATPAQATPIPSPQPGDLFDINDQLTLAAAATFHLLTVRIETDGTVTFDLPRAETGQGITTACAMVIADELDVPVDRVRITLADARPELGFNQVTGGSNTMHALYEPLRVAAATARQQLLTAAATKHGGTPSDYSLVDGVISGAAGLIAQLGDLAELGAVSQNAVVRPTLKPTSALKLLGRDQPRIDGRSIVTGEKRFAMDLEVPGALPTMVCRAPTINGRVLSVDNRGAVARMPGVTDVVVVPQSRYVQSGIAVRAATFGQCIDAVRALKVRWHGGPVDDEDDRSVIRDLDAALPAMTPALPGTAVERGFTFHFRPRRAPASC